MAEARGAGQAGGVVISGMGVTSAFGRGTGPLLDGALSGQPAFGRVDRFDTGPCRVKVGALLPGAPTLADELAWVLNDAAKTAGLDAAELARTPLLIGLHSDSAAARKPGAVPATGDTARRVAQLCGMAPPDRVYATACVAASTAVADAAAMIVSGRAERVMVSAGFLVDADVFWLFDAGRTLAADGQVRPFSAGRRGLLLGDAVAAVLLESGDAAAGRGAAPLARLAGWGRAGDAYHVCQPHPGGSGLARAIGAALERAKVDTSEVGYINASGTGTSASDASETAALHLALGHRAVTIPVSSTKSVHGHALEASALLELVVTVLALQAGQLPVNAGYLAADEACDLDLVLGTARAASPRYALSLNAAFGGANTALLLAAA
jgi:3-oxoacyl-(acyl-carrier-protein) synthase